MDGKELFSSATRGTRDKFAICKHMIWNQRRALEGGGGHLNRTDAEVERRGIVGEEESKGSKERISGDGEACVPTAGL